MYIDVIHYTQTNRELKAEGTLHDTHFAAEHFVLDKQHLSFLQIVHALPSSCRTQCMSSFPLKKYGIWNFNCKYEKKQKNRLYGISGIKYHWFQWYTDTHTVCVPTVFHKFTGSFSGT
jgi:hypothetical protein